MRRFFVPVSRERSGMDIARFSPERHDHQERMDARRECGLPEDKRLLLNIGRIALAFLPAIVFGSILWQSFALAKVYGGDAFEAFFLTKLAARSIQFVVTFVLDTLIVWLLYRSKVFTATKLWPPVMREKK